MIHGCRHINELPESLEAVIGGVNEQSKDHFLRGLRTGLHLCFKYVLVALIVD